MDVPTGVRGRCRRLLAGLGQATAKRFGTSFSPLSTGGRVATVDVGIAGAACSGDGGTRRILAAHTGSHQFRIE